VTTPGRAAVLDDRDVPEPADRHLVDRDRDRVVVTEDDGIGRHEVADLEGVEAPAGRLHDRVPVREDPDETALVRDEHAVGLGRVHLRDRDVERRVPVRPSARWRAEIVQVLAHEATVERHGVLGTSWPARSAPQLSQTSAPVRLS
jgi:hypothetical protein